jgi:hypothetical protein
MPARSKDVFAIPGNWRPDGPAATPARRPPPPDTMGQSRSAGLMGWFSTIVKNHQRFAVLTKKTAIRSIACAAEPVFGKYPEAMTPYELLGCGVRFTDLPFRLRAAPMPTPERPDRALIMLRCCNSPTRYMPSALYA